MLLPSELRACGLTFLPLLSEFFGVVWPMYLVRIENIANAGEIDSGEQEIRSLTVNTKVVCHASRSKGTRQKSDLKTEQQLLHVTFYFKPQILHTACLLIDLNAFLRTIEHTMHLKLYGNYSIFLHREYIIPYTYLYVTS